MMNMFGAYFGSMLMQVSDEMGEANKANKRKMQEAVDMMLAKCKML